MYPRSSRFDNETKQTNDYYLTAELRDLGGNLLYDLTEFKITEGQVNIDSGQKIRRSGSISFVDDTGTHVPEKLGDLLAPLGNHIHLGRGFVFPDGTLETVPLGVFEIQNVSISDNGDSVEFDLDLADLSQILSRRKFTRAYSIDNGTNVVQAAQNIIQIRYPEITWASVAATSFGSPPQHFQVGGDPLEKVNNLMASIGYEFYMDPNGQGVIRQLPTIDKTAPAWTFEEGDDCMILSIQRSLKIEGFANHIIMQGQGGTDDPPIIGEAILFDMANHAAIGWVNDIPDVLRRNDVNSAAQANAVAQAELQKRAGLTETINMQTLVHPAFQANDLVVVNSGPSKTFGYWVADAVSIPLVQFRGMNVTGRRAI
jgi:hypothetical protein